MATETGSRLDALVTRYGASRTAPTSPREQAYSALDSATYRQDKKQLRLSAGPAADRKTTIGTIQADMAGIQLDLTELADRYGKLSVSFKNLVGKNSLYNLGDAFKIGYYKSTFRDKKANEVRREAIGRKGDAVERLVNKMAEVLQEQHQKALDGKERADSLLSQNVERQKTLDRDLIDSLKKGRYTFADQFSADKEVEKLEVELKDIEDVLSNYERDVNKARAGGDLEAVANLTGEMSEVLDMKHGVLDGRLSADGVVSNIRRQMLDSAESVQSAKGAISASKVNYQALGALADAMNELSVKYKYALRDMIPVFKEQGAIASLGTQALDMKQALLDSAEISNRLMDANSRLVTHLAAETFELLRTPLYDPERAKVVEEQIRGYMKQLNALKVEWATNQQSIENVRETAGNVVHQ